MRRRAKYWLAPLYALSPKLQQSQKIFTFQGFFFFYKKHKVIGRMINSFRRFRDISKIKGEFFFFLILDYNISHILCNNVKKSEFKRGWKFLRGIQIFLILKINLYLIFFSLKFSWFLRKIILKFFFPSRLSIKRISWESQWSLDINIVIVRTIATGKLSLAQACSEQRVGEASPDTIMFKPVVTRSLFSSSSISLVI